MPEITTSNSTTSNPKGAGRKKGSKNEFTKKEFMEMKRELDELKEQKSVNAYDDVIDSFVDGFVLQLTQNLKTISTTTLQTWFSSPDDYMTEINDLLTYYYIIDGDISQLYDLIFNLPSLTYKINAYDILPSHDEDIKCIRQMLEKQIKHKTLTRNLLIQLSHAGTVLGTWMGSKKEPYFHVFNDLDYIYPYGMFKGQMTGVFDLEYVDKNYDTEEKRQDFFKQMSPLVTKAKYDKWKRTNELVDRLIVLPPDTSLVARTRILSSNQRLGIPNGTQAVFDIEHKQKLKELEKAISDKIIRAIAVVSLNGKDDNEMLVKESVQKKVFNKVKKALEQNTKNTSGITCIGLPSFAKFTYPEMPNATDNLNSDKYKNINADISQSIGIATDSTTYATANMKLDIFYKKIGVLLEQIEEIYNQLIVILLGKDKALNYTFEYDKERPLSKSEKLEVFKTLANQGYAISPMLELVGIDSHSYIQQSIYEIETLKLRDKIIPPLNSNNISSDDDNVAGRTKVENPTNESTENSQENDSNESPKPSKKKNK